MTEPSGESGGGGGGAIGADGGEVRDREARANGNVFSERD